MTTEELKTAALDIAKDDHCRYCDGWENDPRLKCRRDIEFAAENIVNLVEKYAMELMVLGENITLASQNTQDANPSH